MNDDKLVPCLWFDNNAKEAVEFYVSIFKHSKITRESIIYDTPSGDALMLAFTLAGQNFEALNGGPDFHFNSAFSLMVNFDSDQEKDPEAYLRATWDHLKDGGKVLMELGEYPFSQLYGWVEDKYGLNWQLILTQPGNEMRPFIMPALLFSGPVYYQAQKAREFYLDVFAQSQPGPLLLYGSDDPYNQEGSVMFSDLSLKDTWLVLMDGQLAPGMTFSEAISLIIYVDTQEEIDYFHERLNHVDEADVCGWVKDQFGISWQIVPRRLNEMLQNGTRNQRENVTQALLQMKKIELALLEAAYQL